LFSFFSFLPFKGKGTTNFLVCSCFSKNCFVKLTNAAKIATTMSIQMRSTVTCRKVHNRVSSLIFLYFTVSQESVFQYSFHLSGFSLRNTPKNGKVEPPCTAYNKQHLREDLSSRFHLNGQQEDLSKITGMSFSALSGSFGAFSSDVCVN